MAKSEKALLAFNKGEITPLLDGRTDIEPVTAACRRLRNMIVSPEGGVSRRPGLQFIAITGAVPPLTAEDPCGTTIEHGGDAQLFRYEGSGTKEFTINNPYAKTILGIGLTGADADVFTITEVSESFPTTASSFTFRLSGTATGHVERTARINVSVAGFAPFYLTASLHAGNHIAMPWRHRYNYVTDVAVGGYFIEYRGEVKFYQRNVVVFDGEVSVTLDPNADDDPGTPYLDVDVWVGADADTGEYVTIAEGVPTDGTWIPCNTFVEHCPGTFVHWIFGNRAFSANTHHVRLADYPSGWRFPLEIPFDPALTAAGEHACSINRCGDTLTFDGSFLEHVSNSFTGWLFTTVFDPSDWSAGTTLSFFNQDTTNNEYSYTRDLIGSSIGGWVVKIGLGKGGSNFEFGVGWVGPFFDADPAIESD